MIIYMKRLLSLMLIVIFVIIPVTPVSSQEADVEIIIHYQRDDGDYEKWNIWSWAAGKDGTAYPFNGEDDFGKIAIFTIADAETSVGFIVRTDSWEKDVSEDRFIDLTIGNEIWVFSGQSEFFYEAPEGYGSTTEYDELEVIIYRHRYDNAYDEEHAVIILDDRAYLSRIDGDDFGVTYRALLQNVTNRERYELQFNVEGPDGMRTETFDLALSNVPDGEEMLFVYAVQGQRALVYGERPVIEKKVRDAVIETPSRIYVRLSYPAELVGGLEDFYVTDSEGNEISLSSAERINEVDFTAISDNYDNEFILTTAAPAALGAVYTVSKDGYESKFASIGNLFFGSEEFEAMYTFTGELGALYSKDKTEFCLWAPTATAAYVNLYPDGHQSDRSEELEMEPIGHGAWQAVKSGDLDGVYYTFSVDVNGRINEAIDPYAKAAGVNGKRGMVIDLASTDPPGWENDTAPPFDHPTDAIIYELHIRDFSVSESSGMVNKGKYLAFTENGTTNSEGSATGVDYLVELGITHLHLLPSFDFRSIDERTLELNNFNWGYDPENYNLPEGSYSTDPYNGHVRITEFKQMVQSLHNNGLRVVMDVVYNHTGATTDSNLNLLVPGYYYRMNEQGDFSNGSGCGNETASERSMMRKFIIDSVVHWVTEYNIDGFRFDLMGLHDIDTMNAVRAALDEIDPTILIYGEGWTGGSTPLPEEQQALKMNTYKLDEHIAAFSDDMRDGIKGHVFDNEEPGFVSGNLGRREDVMFGIAASCFHPQIDYSMVSYSDAPWARAPSQAINYASAHDNLTLWDKFNASRPDIGEAEYIRYNKMSALLVLTSQGIPFFQAGEEFARSKYGDENSYQSHDLINNLDWNRKSEFSGLVEYYKGLIELRKSLPLFRLRSAGDIADSITFLDTEQYILAYTIEYDDKTILIAVNTDENNRELTLPDNGWDILVDGDTAGVNVIGRVNDNKLDMPALTGFVLIQNSRDDREAPPASDTPSEPEQTNSMLPTILTLSITGTALLTTGAVLWISSYRKKKAGKKTTDS